MKIREKRRLLIYLELLLERFITEQRNETHPNVIKYFSTEELIDIVLWMYPKTWTFEALENRSDKQLLELIGSDSNIVLYLIDQIEKSTPLYPQLRQEEVTQFFSRTQNEMHYLASKPVDQWDKYDVSNYRSLLLKTGTTKKVFGIFTSDVLAEDVYAVTTKPSYFFDTYKEAEDEIKNIELAGQFKANELTIHKLYLIT
ncbi:hypothetical protein [Psychroserpens algicola]|uniref:Uncharacterized protein n=1 Tax=Psychroserpens algicola TaxID=1719034 RepID=A0ABT0H3T0_9FLAO|nr:hypothetical protein [Psychroserpens algicola]MCK8479038.1 hypothetical protein [Psychroserpens algicola]